MTERSNETEWTEYEQTRRTRWVSAENAFDDQRAKADGGREIEARAVAASSPPSTSGGNGNKAGAASEAEPVLKRRAAPIQGASAEYLGPLTPLTYTVGAPQGTPYRCATCPHCGYRL